MTRVGRRWGALAAAALAAAVPAVAGCTADGAPPPRPAPSVVPAWRASVLPAPPGPAGRLLLREAAACPGRVFVVGAVQDAAGGTRPAAWSSTDGTTWVPLTVAARSYYGRQNVLATAACTGGRLAAVGAKSGGAHGNPRTSSWQQSADGVLREVAAPFELFGGPRAVNVARLAAGPRGWLICGNRMSGAAVWTSPDATGFTIVEGAPGLAADAAGVPWAFDAAAVPGGWLVAGGFLPAGRIDRDAAGWRSPDGRSWRRVPAADATPAYEELQRVAVLGGVPVAAGLRGGAFGAWRLDGDRWRPVGSFGAVPAGGGASVRSLAVVGDRLVAAVADGSAYGVWTSGDAGVSWRAVALPAGVRVATETAVVVAGGGPGVVLVTDDAGAGRVHTAATVG